MKREMHVYADPATIRKVEAIAKAERRSITAQCAVLIEEALAARAARAKLGE